jgi:hypothetical protein
MTLLGVGDEGGGPLYATGSVASGSIRSPRSDPSARVVRSRCSTGQDTRRHKRTSAFFHPLTARFNEACQQSRPRSTTTSWPCTGRRNPQKRRKPAPNAQVNKAEPQGRQPGQVGSVGFAELAVVGFDEVEVSDDADFSAVADVESVVSRRGLSLNFVEQRWAPWCGKSR